VPHQLETQIACDRRPAQPAHAVEDRFGRDQLVAIGRQHWHSGEHACAVRRQRHASDFDGEANATALATTDTTNGGNTPISPGMPVSAGLQSILQLHTLAPWTRGVATIGPEVARNVANRMRSNAGMPTIPRPQTSDSSPAGQYVGPNDMVARYTVPGYVPQQDWQNALRQDPLAGLLGTMQKPAPKPPIVDPRY